MEKEKLINLVRPNQILWKKSSSEFLQAGKKADLWIAIAQEYPDSVSGIKLVLFYNKGSIPPGCAPPSGVFSATFSFLIQLSLV